MHNAIKRLIFYIFCAFCLPSFTCALEPYTLEKITVKLSEEGSSPPSLSSDCYSQETIAAKELEENNLNSVADILNYVSGVDLRTRGAFGIQGDISLRGSTFEQVAVLIDGIKLMDPQTGHHNLDIPLTPFDIERVEITKEAASAVYGAGASAGSVNIITKKPQKKSLKLEAFGGDYALSAQAFSFSFPQKDFSARVSFDHQAAKAARPNTDFENQSSSFYFSKDFAQTSLNALFGFQKKDFGADSFYSNLFPEEEEHTQTLFFKTGLNTKLGSTKLKNNLYLRKHRDKFILRRNNPTSVNYHTTYVYGLNSGLELPTRLGNFLLGLDIGEDEINSTNLGKHSRLYEAGSLGLASEFGRLNTDLRFRLDYYQKWLDQESFNFGLGYKVNDSLRLKTSLAKAFRIPTFTDLYYADAANKGDPNLKVEKSYTYNLGLDYGLEKKLVLGLEGFWRRGENLIDYTRATSNDVWQATNLGRVDFRGGAFSFKLKPELNYHELKLNQVAFAYNYTDVDKKASGFLSKYALDVLKHQFILDLDSRVFNLSFNWHLTYQQRYYGETYFVAGLYIGTKLPIKDFTLEPFVKVDNLTNTKYSEITGVLQPGRWVQGGVKFEW